MKIVGSVIARLGSKRLTFKNLLPYKGEPLVVRAVRKLLLCDKIDQVIVSTDSELIARTCLLDGIDILYRPESLAGDQIASIPVFQHIVENFPCDMHVNYNCNFPECSTQVFDKALDICKTSGEALSDPFAVWAQTSDCLKSYVDPMKITANKFQTDLVQPPDIHTLEDLLEAHRTNQSDFIF
mgnify:CR=1 FL=1